MEITMTVKNNYLFVKLKGDLDMHSAEEFKKKVSQNMKEYDLDHLVLNLKQVKFIDSTGLGAILGRYRIISKQDGKMILVGLKPQVKRIFELSGVLKLMQVYETEKEIQQKLKLRGGNSIA